MASRIASGIWKGRGIRTSVQYGKTPQHNPQVAIALRIKRGDEERIVTTFLVFSKDSSAFSVDRLRALGWRGNDVRNLDGIDDREVDVDVYYEEWEGDERLKAEIVSGGFTFDERSRMVVPSELETFANLVLPFAKQSPPRAATPTPTPSQQTRSTQQPTRTGAAGGTRSGGMPDDDRFG